MQRFILLSVLLALFAMFTMVLSVDLTPLFFENLQPAMFSGEINGVAYQLNGTVEEVVAQLQKRFPDLQLDNNATLVPLAARNKAPPPLCLPIAGWDWSNAFIPAIQNGIQYLIGLNQRITLNGFSCSRISCSYKSAIYFCNENNYAISPASPYLASYAADIISYCSEKCPEGCGDDPNVDWAGGQEFDSDGYDIIVRYDNYRC